jgi:hypothetical protein
LVEQFLAIFEVIVERALGDAGFLGDAGDGCLGVTILADDLGGGVKYLALGPGVALDRLSFVALPDAACDDCVMRDSSSARSTRLRTFPEGLRGRLSRMISCFGTLKPARRARQ